MLQTKFIPFKIKYDSQERKAKSAVFLTKNEGFVPLIVEPIPNSRIAPLENSKFSV